MWKSLLFSAVENPRRSTSIDVDGVVYVFVFVRLRELETVDVLSDVVYLPDADVTAGGLLNIVVSVCRILVELPYC